jgi:predicted amidohydrolase
LVRLPHWQSLITARAIENQVFVAGVNRLGNDNGTVFAGTSMLVSPYGNVLTSGSQIHEALLTSEMDLQFIKTVRSQIKVYQDRRTELYQEILK